MRTNKLAPITLASLLGTLTLHAEAAEWIIDSHKDWKENIESSEGAVFEKGSVSPKAKTATMLTKLRSFDNKRSASSLTVAQSTVWQNWIPTKNIGPSNLKDAPVLLTMEPNNYWMLGRYGTTHRRNL
jgi:hypothetical protein